MNATPIHRGMNHSYRGRAGWHAAPAGSEMVDRLADTGIDCIRVIILVNAEAARSTRQFIASSSTSPTPPLLCGACRFIPGSKERGQA